MMEHPIHACVFDAYGTLFDTQSAVYRHQSRLGERTGGIAAVWRQKQLEYTWLRSLMGTYVDFEHLVADALQYAFDKYELNDPTLHADILADFQALDCFPEVPAVLQQIKAQGIGVAILSNGTRAMIESCIRHAGLESLIDAVLSVDSVGIYKPSPRAYELAIDHYGPPVPGIAFQSANAWDIAGAAHFGFSSIWINRRQEPAEILPGKATCMLHDLKGLPDLITEPGN